MAQLLRRIFKYQVGNEMKKPVAQLPPEISPNDLANNNQESRQGETVLGNWIADSMVRWYHKHPTEIMKPLSDLILIMTGGSIRTGLDVNPKKVLQGDIVSLNPFTSSLVTLKLTGKALRKALEQALRDSHKLNPTDTTHNPSGAFPIVSGIMVEWDSTKPIGSRVQKLTLSSKTVVKQDIDPEHVYNILTDSYLAGGGDGLTALQEGTNSVDSEVPVYRALLTDINDISVEDAQKLVEQPSAPAPEAASASSLEDAISAFPIGLAVLIPSLLPIIAGALASEDRPRLVAEKAMDRVVEMTKDKKLPVLKIPKQVDGRMKDISIK